MALLTVQDITLAGVAQSAVAAAATDTFPNDGRTFVEVINGGGSDDIITFTTPATVQGVAIADPTVTVAAGARKCIGPFPTSIFNDASGLVTMANSFITSVTTRVMRLP